MSKETKLLLGMLVLSTVALAVFQYWLHTQSLRASLLTAHIVNKDVQLASGSANNALAEQTASGSATSSATPAVKTASASATVRPRTTASPTVAPEPTPEE